MHVACSSCCPCLAKSLRPVQTHADVTIQVDAVTHAHAIFACGAHYHCMLRVCFFFLFLFLFDHPVPSSRCPTPVWQLRNTCAHYSNCASPRVCLQDCHLQVGDKQHLASVYVPRLCLVCSVIFALYLTSRCFAA